MKIFLSGFLHETNTFVSSRASYIDFTSGANGPIVRGHAMLALQGANLAIGGFISEFESSTEILIPGLWAHATPSGPVTYDAYERIVGEIIDGLRASRADAVFLDLHGAMVAEHVDDAEGELLRRVRAVVGPDVPVVATLDLHANVSAQMFESANALVAYRTYPHVDMFETGVRAARALMKIASDRKFYHRGMRRGPFLVPIEAMTTFARPAAELYNALAMLEARHDVDLSIAMGFPAADIPECGPTIWGYGTDHAALYAALNHLYRQLTSREDDWGVDYLSANDAVLKAITLAEHASRPVVIADTHDNPGAGADSNTTEMLAALLRHRVKRAALGIICDPSAAAAAHAAGIGSTLDLTLAADTPRAFQAKFVVEHLSDGVCRLEGPMMRNAEMRLGPCACLSVDGIQVAVSTAKTQMLDLNLYRMFGIEPETRSILVNKSSVHFRAAFEPIAEAILIARTEDGIATDPGRLAWAKLDRSVRTTPRYKQKSKS